MSTPLEASLPTLQRLRVRNPLPRSPLYRSYSHQLSPEGTRSIGLASQLASPRTPRVLFSQPARRSRDYRLHTPAFSRGESSKDSRIDLPLPIERSQPYGSSFQGSGEEVNHPFPPPTRVFHSSVVTQPEDGRVSVNGTNPEVSLHSLQLPPPFLTSSRSVSAGSLPVGDPNSTGRSPRIHNGEAAGEGSIIASDLTSLDEITGGQGLQQSPRVSDIPIAHSVLP